MTYHTNTYQNMTIGEKVVYNAKRDIIFTSIANFRTLKISDRKITCAFSRPTTPQHAIDLAAKIARRINEKMSIYGIVANVEILFGMSIEITW